MLAASAVRFPGRFSCGGVLSRTVTVNEPLVVLPWPSFALQFTVVAPIANVAPEAGLQSTGTDAPKSVALAEKLTAAPPGPVASAVWSPGKLRFGADVSVTDTPNVTLALLPFPSSAEH